MSKQAPIGKRKARRLAFESAASLLENIELDGLFADVYDAYDDGESLDRLSKAKSDVASYLRRAASRVNGAAPDGVRK